MVEDRREGVAALPPGREPVTPSFAVTAVAELVDECDVGGFPSEFGASPGRTGALESRFALVASPGLAVWMAPSASPRRHATDSRSWRSTTDGVAQRDRAPSAWSR